MKDEVEKRTCRNERQIIKKIEAGEKYLLAYGDIKVSKETAQMIREKKIKILPMLRKKKGQKQCN